ncbi:endothelin-converting enzyme homolog [Haemaphysalis longicornis]
MGFMTEPIQLASLDQDGSIGELRKEIANVPDDVPNKVSFEDFLSVNDDFAVTCITIFLSLNQYDSYVTFSLQYFQLNGQRTVRRNIADNGGLNLAFAAFQKLQRELPNATLPGLENFTTEQIFFISFAMPWCTAVTDSYLKQQIEVDLYSPMKYRINVPLKNNPEFSAAFHCKEGSSMRLPDEQRCFIW